MSEKDIVQYLNGISSNIGRVADSIGQLTVRSTTSINNLNETLSVTNILLAILVLLSIANFILKLKKR
ncbi:hypothetical protein [Paenibacillus agri]|uniref:Uncharacterized protein n=1 Tax=Paenibacillus agri TaxID=2744309 RepID=A0A850EQ90_9BACL|nr:hypothetical protein [Paenibacillus agri]NUU61910.1 hypothetical protein [Paenibacillus agri]